MAIITKARWLRLRPHRPWQNIVSIGLGAAIVVSALLLGESGHQAMVVSSGLTGALVLALATLEIVSFRPWEERLEIVSGLWLAVAPWVLVYEGLARQVHVVLGLCVYALGLVKFVQDRKSEPAN